MSLEREEKVSNKKSGEGSDNPNPGRRGHKDDKPLRLCPFQGFRVCDESCKYYVCHGYCKIIAERIKKGYANEYLSSVLF
ncbi:MAG: hypothetical protein ACXQTB_02085 [Candidatus Nezhaarchaeales archaeon]